MCEVRTQGQEELFLPFPSQETRLERSKSQWLLLGFLYSHVARAIGFECCLWRPDPRTPTMLEAGNSQDVAKAPGLFLYTPVTSLVASAN